VNIILNFIHLNISLVNTETERGEGKRERKKERKKGRDYIQENDR